MRQRAMIAMALSCNPKIILADEPTTALDVTIQAQILDLLKELQREEGMSIVYVTHNMAVVAETVDRVYVMYLGQVVESTTTQHLFANPLHPYTQKLLRSIPKPGERVDRLEVIAGHRAQPQLTASAVWICLPLPDADAWPVRQKNAGALRNRGRALCALLPVQQRNGARR